MDEKELKAIEDLTKEIKRQNDIAQEKNEVVVVKKSIVKKIFIGFLTLLFVIWWKNQIKNNK